MFHAKFNIAGLCFSPLSKKWPKHGHHMVLKIGSSWIFINLPRDVPCQISHCCMYPLAPLPRNGQIWPKHVPSNWVFLNLNHCAQGCSMPNFTLLGLSCTPLSSKLPKHGPFMAKTWSSYGPSNWFFLNLNQCAQGCSMPNFTLLGVSCSTFPTERKI